MYGRFFYIGVPMYSIKYTCMRTYIICTHIHTYTYIHTCIHTYIHKHTHIHTRPNSHSVTPIIIGSSTTFSQLESEEPDRL